MRCRGKRSQAAIEYLATYGWTVLVLLVTIGMIVYFDVLSPIKFIPEQCEFGEQLVCADMILDEDGDFTLRFLNNFPKRIVLIDAISQEYTLTCPNPNTYIEAGEYGDLTCETVTTFAVGDKVQMRVKVLFRRAVENEPPINNCNPACPTPIHEISGVFVTTVEE